MKLKSGKNIVVNSAIAAALLVNQYPAWCQNSETSGSVVPANISVPSANDKLMLPELTQHEQEVFELVQDSQYSEAKKLILSHLDKANSSENRERLKQLAYVEMRLENYSEAIKDLQEAMPAADTKDDPESTRQRVQILRRIGNICLEQRKKQEAVNYYKSALKAGKSLDQSDPLIIGVLEPLVGILNQDELFIEARPFAEQLVSSCEERAKSGDLVDVSALFWAYMGVGPIYKALDPGLQLKNFAKAMSLFDQLTKLRKNYETENISEAEALVDELQKGLFRAYIAENKPSRLSDYFFLSSEFRFRALPLVNWQAANNTPKAAILCVHGLGLENRAFGPFGRQMASKGFCVYAMDVRGFGAWQNEYGSESVDFKRALKDLRLVLNVIKFRHPGLPIFLCGESMGGAIVLTAAAEYGGEVAGIISSVPSAERYGGKKMAAQVALHLLRSPNKPFNIGKQIATQATKKADLRELWKKDPKAKSDLSPVELIKFDLFMKETKKRCSEIRKTPVLVVQGLADQLVKPQGTYEMFDNVNSPDKSMLIIGNAEHLILETPNQSKVLLDGLASWLDNHIMQKQQ